MLSTVVMVLSLGVMLFLIASLTIGAIRERRHYLRISTTQGQMPPDARSQSIMSLANMHNEVTKEIEKYTRQSGLPPHSIWYRSRRTLVSLGLLLMIVLTLFAQSGLADGVLKDLSIGFSSFVQSHSFALDLQTPGHLAQGTASQQLVRIWQLDPNQYSSIDEFNTWAYSACSTASMTEVFDAYGYHYRITDVLKVEAQIGEITPQQGLIEEAGIQRTAAQFGFKTSWGHTLSLDQVITTANQGKPVIVSFPPDRYDGGHLLVVIGGDSNFVYLADSSGWNRHSLARWQFLNWWEGFSAVVTPG
jgi:Peptidase_C39 like family